MNETTKRADDPLFAEPNSFLHPQPFQFNLQSLFLVMTLIALCLVACKANPILGLITTGMSFLSLGATYFWCADGAEAGKNFSALEKIERFLRYFLGLALWLFSGVCMVGAVIATFLILAILEGGLRSEHVMLVGLISLFIAFAMISYQNGALLCGVKAKSPCRTQNTTLQ